MSISTVSPFGAPISFGSSKCAAKKPAPVTALVNQDRLVDEFVSFAKINTQSRRNAKSFPSTPGQTKLANILAERLRGLGLNDVNVDEHSVVTATLPSNLDVQAPTIGLVSHMDTSDQAPGANVKPTLHTNYQGGDLVLKGGTVIPAADLESHIGEDIISSDGRTLLGSDDKAGIAEILETLRVFNENPQLKHPKLRIAFTPDEETSEFIENFDINGFGADYAYTVDGESAEAIEDSSFNAHWADITINGRSMHPGYAYDLLINAITMAGEFMGAIPPHERPETTRGLEGYYFPLGIKGTDSKAKLSMLIRDFDINGSMRRIEFLKGVAAELEKRHPGSKVAVEVTEQYRNMFEILSQHPEVISAAEEGIRRTGLTPRKGGIRGGTDGCELTEKGLPTPNLGTGGYNFHSKREFVTKQDMVSCVGNIVNTLGVWAERAVTAAAQAQPTAAVKPASQT